MRAVATRYDGSADGPPLPAAAQDPPSALNRGATLADRLEQAAAAWRRYNPDPVPIPTMPGYLLAAPGDRPRRVSGPSDRPAGPAPWSGLSDDTLAVMLDEGDTRAAFCPECHTVHRPTWADPYGKDRTGKGRPCVPEYGRPAT